MKGILYRFCATILAVPIAAWLLPGVHVINNEVAWVAGVMLGLIYLILRPLVKLLLTPFNCLTLGILGFLVDIGLVNLAEEFIEGFFIDGFWWSVAVAMVVSVVRELIGRLAGIGRAGG